MTAACPLGLTIAGRVTEAWEYVQYLLEFVPHAVTYVTASIVCYHRSVNASAENRKELLEEQLVFVERAREAYQSSPAEQQNHPDMREYMAFGFEVAALTCLMWGNEERSKAAWDQAVKLGANPTTAWATRAFVPSPNDRDGKEVDIAYLSERVAHFSTRFASEQSSWERSELVGA
jgi:hypothetical protein